MTIGTSLNTDGPNLESKTSGIHWAAILGGAAAAAAISLILIPLGTALGFSSFSVFAANEKSAITFGIGWAIWLVVMQWVSSGFGGYIAGRLRVKWADLHSDEVFFRDTAHGFLAWAVATVLTISLVACLSMNTVHAGVEAGSTVAAGAANNDKLAYSTDSLFRGATGPDINSAEAGRILATELNGTVSADDRAYLATLVASRTGLSQAEAQTRVNNAIAQIDAAKTKAAEAAEAARKATVGFSVALFLSLLVGAFIACVTGALGGRLRDNY